MGNIFYISDDNAATHHEDGEKEGVVGRGRGSFEGDPGPAPGLRGAAPGHPPADRGELQLLAQAVLRISSTNYLA